MPTRASDKEWVKTTVRLPEALWRRAKIRAVEERSDFQAVLIEALTAFLATPPAKKGGRK